MRRHLIVAAAVNDNHPPVELTAPLRRLITAALERAYEQTIQRWDPLVGYDNQTFGQMVFKSGWHYLEQFLKGESGVVVRRPQNSFEIQIGSLLLHPYKVPHPDGELHPDLPSNEAVLKFMAESNATQAELFPGAEPKKYILAHVGGAFTGLRAVYVGVPIPGASEESYEWASVCRIDDLVESRGDRPEAVEIDLPEVVSRPAEESEKKERA